MILEFLKTAFWNLAWVVGAIFGFALGTAISDLIESL